MNKYQENLNKKIEETKKTFEKMFSCPVSYHEKGGWDGKNGHFTIKLRNNKKDSKQEIENFLKKETGNDITHHGENNQGGVVISRKFKNPEIERQKNELIEEGIKGNKKQIDEHGNSLHRHFVDSGDDLTYSIERKNKDGVVKESYTERNQKRREQELEEKKKDLEKQNQNQKDSQTENSPNYDSQEQEIEKDNNSQNQSQKTTDNKDNNSKNIYYGIGMISLTFLVAGIVVWVKKKR